MDNSRSLSPCSNSASAFPSALPSAQNHPAIGAVHTVPDLFLFIDRWQKSLSINTNKEGVTQQPQSQVQNQVQNQARDNAIINQIIIRILWLKFCEEQEILPRGTLLIYAQSQQPYQAFLQLFQTLIASNFAPNPLIQTTRFQAVLCQAHALKVHPLLEGSGDINHGHQGYKSTWATILGHVYEYLGNTSEKKIRGRYYTPMSVVNCMIDQTLGPFYSIKNLADFTILDPACGAGIFLIAAYQYLLKWYGQHSDQPLDFETKKKILIQHIYGVDLDQQAVEVTQLSLLMLLLTGEHLVLEQLCLETVVLPELTDNIKLGNALINWDIGQNQATPLSTEQLERIRPFDWCAEFPHIFRCQPQNNQQNKNWPGFDVVLGNPPYIDSEWMSQYHPEERQYCSTHYKTASGNWDIFCIFCEKALQLCRPNGLTSFIVPNKLAAADYAKQTRQLLSIDNQLLYLRDYSDIPVFSIAVYPLVYVVKKGKPKNEQLTTAPVQWERVLTSPKRDSKQTLEQRLLDYNTYFSEPERPWAIAPSDASQNLLTRIRQLGVPLEQVATVVGAATVSEAYTLKTLIYEQSALTKTETGLETEATYFKFINSGTIDPYVFLWGEKPVRYLKTRYQAPVIPWSQAIYLPSKRLKQAQQPKIVIAGMTLVLECALDLRGEFFPGKSTTVIYSSPYLDYLSAILNSRLMSTYYRIEFGGTALNGGYLRIGPPQIKQLPIVFGTREQIDEITVLVNKLGQLNKRTPCRKDGRVNKNRRVNNRSRDKMKNDAIAPNIAQEILQEIDQHIYAAYQLSQEDISLIENLGDSV